MKGNLLSFTPKAVLAIVAAVALAISSVAMPLVSDVFAADNQADLESELLVRNGSSGNFSKIADADAGDVVEVQLYYHNQDDAFEGDTAQNLRVSINIPEVAGDRHVLSSTVSADNASTQNDDALVRLAADNQNLDYIEGSATWTHNTGFEPGNECDTGNDTAGAPESCYSTESISDAVVTSSEGLRLENARPCYAHEAWVTIKVKVKEPTPEPEDKKVTADVSFTDVCGVEDDTFSVDEKDGVVYSTDDQRENGVGTVTVTASAEDGFVLEGDSQWSFDFTDEPCEQPEEPQEPEAPKGPEELPSTGVGAVAASVFGSTSVFAGVRSWLKSRRSLRDMLKG